MSHIVVIGAGQAGASLVARLRNDGFDGTITLIGAEPHPPYQRPPLSKAYLLGEMEKERLFLRPESFYAGERYHPSPWSARDRHRPEGPDRDRGRRGDPI